VKDVQQLSAEISWQDVILSVRFSIGLYSTQSQEHGEWRSQSEQTVQLSHDKLQHSHTYSHLQKLATTQWGIISRTLVTFWHNSDDY